jgi:hypothetical protein
VDRPGLLRLLAEAPEQVAGLADLVAPFGFEVMRDPSFESATPHRLYLYACGDASTDGPDLLRGLADWLVDRREELATALGRPLAYVTSGSRRDVRALAPEGLGAHLYAVPAPGRGRDAADAYGDYVALIPVAIDAGVLRELVDFDLRPSCRRFIFQCVRMFPYIHGVELSPDALDALRRAATENGSSGPGHATRVEAPPTEHDLAVLREVVLPVSRDLTGGLAAGATEVGWHDFHSGRWHILVANAEEVARRSAAVADAYRQWTMEEAALG